jgi:hypothetical protein
MRKQKLCYLLSFHARSSQIIPERCRTTRPLTKCEQTANTLGQQHKPSSLCAFFSNGVGEGFTKYSHTQLSAFANILFTNIILFEPFVKRGELFEIMVLF